MKNSTLGVNALLGACADKRQRWRHKPLWLPLVALALAYGIAGGIDRWVEIQPPAASRQPPAAREHHVEFDLRACSPSRVELSPVVYFAVRTHADAEPEILGCTRYAVIEKAKNRGR